MTPNTTPAPAVQAADPVEWAAFQIWKAQRDEQQRKRGAYWLTPEGRSELRSTFDGDDNCVLPLLDALEAAEAALSVQPATQPAVQSYGCHCDLEPWMQPDGCVIDAGRPEDCVKSRRGGIARKEDCPEWRPIAVVGLSVQPVPDAESLAIKALRYWRDECSGGEPSISVFSRMVDEAIASQGASPAATACSASTLGVPASPSIPNADTERLDFMQRTQQTPWRCTEQRRVPSTRGMFDWRIHEEFLGWSANGSDADLRPTIREAIDVAMSAASGTRPEQTAQLPQAEPSDAEDAARYRYLRHHRPVLLLTGFFGNGCVNQRIEEVDAAIDTARAALKQQEQR